MTGGSSGTSATLAGGPRALDHRGGGLRSGLSLAGAPGLDHREARLRRVGLHHGGAVSTLRAELPTAGRARVALVLARWIFLTVDAHGPVPADRPSPNPVRRGTYPSTPTVSVRASLQRDGVGADGPPRTSGTGSAEGAGRGGGAWGAEGVSVRSWQSHQARCRPTVTVLPPRVFPQPESHPPVRPWHAWPEAQPARSRAATSTRQMGLTIGSSAPAR